MEKWKEIEGWPEYWVSDRGLVKSLKYGKTKILKPGLNIWGYLKVGLYRDSKRKWFLVHRLVALAFCDGYEENLQVDHINGDKLDNRAENLRWICHALNKVHQHKARSESGFIGVYRYPGCITKPYRAQANDGSGKLKHIGMFATAEDASAARDEFVRKRFSCEELMFHHSGKQEETF